MDKNLLGYMLMVKSKGKEKYFIQIKVYLKVSLNKIDQMDLEY
jgi:hypothetical protein